MSSNVEYSVMKSKLQEFDNEHHDEYDRVGIFRLEPQTRVRKMTLKSEVDAHKSAHQKQIDDAAELQKKNGEEKAKADAEIAKEEAARRKPNSEPSKAVKK